VASNWAISGDELKYFIERYQRFILAGFNCEWRRPDRFAHAMLEKSRRKIRQSSSLSTTPQIGGSTGLV
jgi:hypothetical protein